MRIGSLWIHTNQENVRTTAGEIGTDAGINIPAGVRLACKIVKNDKKTQGDKMPDFFIEAWPHRDQVKAGQPKTTEESSPF